MIVYIRITNDCNLHCSHCFNKNKNTKINYEQLKTFLKEINTTYSNNYFILHGGEPMLLDINLISKIMSDFPDNNWQISTNLCYKLTQDKINIFKRSKKITTSFDIGIRFKNIKNLILWYKNVKKISSIDEINLKLNICLSKSIIKHNPLDILKFLDKLHINSVDFFQIIQTSEMNSAMIPNNHVIDQWMCDLYKANKKFPKIQCSNINQVKNKILQKNAQYFCSNCCKSTITINPDGTIINCPGDNYFDTIGTIYDPINMIINNIDKKIKIKEKCFFCDHYKECQGWCRNITWNDYTCAFPERLFKEIKKDYVSTFI